jgi:ribosomal protein S18 acetylase RimI-like enzyme
VAWDGDQVAGVSMNWIEDEENARVGVDAGWLGNVSVRRPWRRRGVGRALLLHAFRELHARGAERVGLGVDAQNPSGATRLYESVGMAVEADHATFAKPL